MRQQSSTTACGALERTGHVAVLPGGAAASLVWTYRPGSARCAYVAPPDGYADVVIGVRATRVTMHLIGAALGATSKPTDDIVFTCAARLRSGVAAALTGVSARSLRSRAVLLDDAWSASVLGQVVEAPSMEQRAERLLRALDERLRSRPRTSVDLAATDRVVRGVRAIEPREDPSLREAARRVGVSERTLRRVFDDAVGISPRAFRALPRFRRALELLASPGAHGDGAAIAAAAGYADQPHMIRDVRARTGHTPSELRNAWRDGGVLFRPGT